MKNILVNIVLIVFILIVGYLIFDSFSSSSSKNILPQTNTTSITQAQKKNRVEIHYYSNPSMHLSFIPANNEIISQVNPQLLAINNPSDKNPDNTLFLYSTTVAEGTTNLTQPFAVQGSKESESTVPVPGFEAKQVTYSDGKTETILIFLKQKKQLFVLKIPQNSQSASNAITDIINSISVVQ